MRCLLHKVAEYHMMTHFFTPQDPLGTALTNWTACLVLHATRACKMIVDPMIPTCARPINSKVHCCCSAPTLMSWYLLKHSVLPCLYSPPFQLKYLFLSYPPFLTPDVQAQVDCEHRKIILPPLNYLRNVQQHQMGGIS